MSVSSMGGASASNGTNPLLAAMLARLQQAEQAQQSASTSDQTTTTQTSTAQTSTTQASDGCAATNTSSDLTALSDQVVGTLVMMQGQDGPGTSSQGSGTSSTSDPVQQAFSSIDTDGDGTISQTELESFIENQGGTAGQADALYQGLGGTDGSGISQSNFASAAQVGGPGGAGGAHGHHHHHHGGSGASATDASQIFGALDSNDDGSISSDELTSALTAAGSTASASNSSSSSGSSSNDLFSAIDTDGNGAISQNELSSYLTSLQQQMQTDQGTLSAFASLASQSYTAGGNLFAANTTQSISA